MSLIAFSASLTAFFAASVRASLRSVSMAFWSVLNASLTRLTCSLFALAASEQPLPPVAGLVGSSSAFVRVKSARIAGSTFVVFGLGVRNRRIWAAIGAAALVLGLLAYGGVSFRVADGLTKPTRQPLDPPAESVAAVHEDVSFKSTDGLLLKGWWFPVPSADRAVVVVHGRGANRIKSSFDPQKIAQFLIASRYSVLLFDLRGHGESEGLRYSLGEYEPRDVVAAIDFAQRKAGIDRKRVAIIGESMGGGSAIMTVKADPTIGPVITVSAFAEGRTSASEG